jgi:hypothetical protein
MAKHRRGRSTTSAASAPTTTVSPLPLSLADVYLLTAESEGREAVGGLTLVVDQDGLTVITPHRTTAARLTWSELTVLKTAGRTRAPGGEEAVLLEATGARRSHRFVVPTEDPLALEATMAEITGIPPPVPNRKSRRRK